MITNDELHIRAEDMDLAIMWRNPLALVRAHLRAREGSDPYYRWAEQAKKIRARRANWDGSHHWAARIVPKIAEVLHSDRICFRSFTRG